MTFNLTDVLRLEVEVPPADLPNLVQNHSGALGAWFWLTPVTNTLITSSGTDLTFRTNISQAAYFTSDFMPVSATQWVAARLDLVSITASHNVKVRFEWYDSNQALLSSSVQSGALSTIGTNYVGAIQAPASTVWVKARVDFYNGVANPSAGATVTFNRVMVPWAATNAFSTTRVNKILNPSFEVNTTGWINETNCAIARTSAVGGFVGSWALSLTASAVGTMKAATSATGTSAMSAYRGTDYTFSVRTRAATTARQVTLALEYYSLSGSPLGTFFSARGNNAVGSWTTHTWTHSAPSKAFFVRALVWVEGAAAGEVHYLDGVHLMVTKPTSVLYFDGSTTSGGGLTYSWSGTAHASASSEVTASYAFSEPQTWRNILGPTSSISVNRADLNVGTLSATVLDALLDPAVDDELRPGRQVRLTALNAYTGTWDPVFTGKAKVLDVQYDVKRLIENSEDLKHARITLNAVDNVSTLAAASRPEGVAPINQLPYVLEGCGVPWNVNGSGNQVSVAGVVSYNENATAIDQVAVTRDSVLGFAWVDRGNVLQAWDPVSPTGVHQKTMPGINLVSNSSFTTNTNNWLTSNTTATRVTSTFNTSPASCQMAATAASDMFLSQNQDSIFFYATAGRSYVASAWSKANTTVRAVGVNIRWYGPTGLFLSSSSGPTTTNTTSWTKIPDFTAVAPAGAARGAVTFKVIAPAAAEVHFVDDITVRETVTLDETTYSNVDVSFSTDQCINEVLIKFLRYANGETTEVLYGPYRNQASVTEWGLHSKTFTIHMATESSVTIQALADSILAANAVPVVRVNSLTIPIRSAADLTYGKAFLDLYDLGHVVLADKGVDEFSRITGLTHTITPEGWLVGVTFSPEGAVASPQVIPSVHTGDITDGTWIVPSFQNGWVNYGSTWETAGYMRRDGIVYLRGLVKSGAIPSDIFTLPVGYRPSSDKHLIVASNATWAVINVFADGRVRTNTNASAAWLSLANISFPAEQ